MHHIYNVALAVPSGCWNWQEISQYAELLSSSRWRTMFLWVSLTHIHLNTVLEAIHLTKCVHNCIYLWKYNYLFQAKFHFIEEAAFLGRLYPVFPQELEEVLDFLYPDSRLLYVLLEHNRQVCRRVCLPHHSQSHYNWTPFLNLSFYCRAMT